MTDIPQEVREAPMSDHERFITAVAYDCGYQAGLAAGKRAGMERAAEIAEEDDKLCDCHAHSESECACGAWWGSKQVSPLAIAQAIRSENDGHG